MSQTQTQMQMQMQPTGTRPLGLLVKTYPKLSETFILEEILGLERLGMALRLYALRAPTDSIVHPDVARVRAPLTVAPQWQRGHRREIAVRHLRLFAAAPVRYLRALLAALGRHRAGEFAQAGWLALQLRRDGIAHLHTHFISTPADVAELAATISALPFSISAHAKDIYLSDAADLRRKLEAARFTVTCTEFNRQTLAAAAPRALVRRMYHGVDGEQFHPRRRTAPPSPPSPPLPPLILSVGRLRAKKGLDTLIDACRLLHERGEAFQCEIIGYGEEHERLLARLLRHGLTGVVSLAGKQPRGQVIAAYARAAVYVQPSRIAQDGDRDGIPNVLLEAMAMGVPVVATGVSGIPELIRDGINGVLVAPDDAQALADAIARLLRAPALGAPLAHAARATVTQSFDNDHNLQLLCDLLHRHGGTSIAVNPPAAARTNQAAKHAPLRAK
jgi:glycosyltransferase involved in cell wall biosynthesis